MRIGDLASENAHGYVSPDASEPYELVSRYEWGPDTISRGRRREVLSGEGREVYPATSDWGRYTTGTSEFTVKIAPENHGVLLRRKLDYAFPNQRAEVFVADPEAESPVWKRAGV